MKTRVGWRSAAVDIASGTLSGAVGTLAILAGLLFRHAGLRTFGHRQRVIGAFHKRHEVDPRTLTAFLDRWTRGQQRV